jgi:predicted nicotinamide N-methyase
VARARRRVDEAAGAGLAEIAGHDLGAVDIARATRPLPARLALATHEDADALTVRHEPPDETAAERAVAPVTRTLMRRMMAG